LARELIASPRNASEGAAMPEIHPSRIIDPRGPHRTITAIGEGCGPTLITKSCGHTSEYANHFTYKLGARIHCYACREASDNVKPGEK
jgi:hypothetical protein